MRATAERPAPVVDLYHVTVDAVTVADAVAELALRLPRSGRSSFRELTGHLTSRIEIIVRFLALLELVRLQAMGVNGDNDFAKFVGHQAQASGTMASGTLTVAQIGQVADMCPVGK